jgi:hypothetical protein
MFKFWKESKHESALRTYCWARKMAGKVVCDVRETERKMFGDMLEKEDRSGNVLGVAGEMVKRNGDVDGGGCIKDCNEAMVVEQDELMEVWKEYLTSFSTKSLTGTAEVLNLMR